MSKSDYACPLSPCSTIRLQREKCDLEIASLKQRIHDGKRQVKEIQRMIEEWQIELIDKTQMTRELKSKEADRLLSDIENKRLLLEGLTPRTDRLLSDIENKRLLLEGLTPRSRRSPKQTFVFQHSEKRGLVNPEDRRIMNQEDRRTMSPEERRNWKQVAMEAAVEDLTGCNPRVVIDECAPRKPINSKMTVRSPMSPMSDQASTSTPTKKNSDPHNLMDDVLSNSCDEPQNEKAKPRRENAQVVEHDVNTQNSLLHQPEDADGRHGFDNTHHSYDHADGGDRSVISISLGEDFAQFFQSLVCTTPSAKNVQSH